MNGLPFDIITLGLDNLKTPTKTICSHGIECVCLGVCVTNSKNIYPHLFQQMDYSRSNWYKYFPLGYLKRILNAIVD